MNRSKVFVGNLPFTTTRSDLEDLFSPFGEVIGVNIREDRSTGKPRGFAFVTFSDETSAEESINSLNGREYFGRTLSVNFATIRGSQRDEGQETADTSWKTVPVSAKKLKEQTANGSMSKPKKSWTEWATPISNKK